MFDHEQRELEPVAHVAFLIDRGQHVLDRLLAEIEMPRSRGSSGRRSAADDVALARSQDEVRCAAHSRPPPITFDWRARKDSGTSARIALVCSDTMSGQCDLSLP